jgi:hypothetical protein
MSEINGKPVDAIGHMVFQIDMDHFKSPFHVEKVFGLIDKKTNAVFKFKLVVNEDGPREIKFKLVYVSEEHIDCQVKIASGPSEILQNMTVGDELKTFNYRLGLMNWKNIEFVSFIISLCVTLKPSLYGNVFARKFNDASTSDFIVKCQDKQFHVHQLILREGSKYFEAILHNDCKEKRENMLRIEDFGPNVVEIFLQYLYNGAIPRISFVRSTESFSLMKIADKYNVNELFDALDSHLSQECMCMLGRSDKRQLWIEHYLRDLEDVQAPKFTTMLYKWRSTEKGIGSLDDKQWSSIIRKNPNFTMLGGITVGRNDNQSWAQQHMSWYFGSDIVRIYKCNGRNDFAVLGGPVGEMKGAVTCSPI